MFGFDMFEIYDVMFEIYIEDKLVKQQKMQAPKELLIANFMQTVNQIAKDTKPIKIKMSRPDTIWDKFENKQRVVTNEIVFCNNAMLDWEKDKE